MPQENSLITAWIYCLLPVKKLSILLVHTVGTFPSVAQSKAHFWQPSNLMPIKQGSGMLFWRISYSVVNKSKCCTTRGKRCNHLDSFRNFCKNCRWRSYQDTFGLARCYVDGEKLFFSYPELSKCHIFQIFLWMLCIFFSQLDFFHRSQVRSQNIYIYIYKIYIKNIYIHR